MPYYNHHLLITAIFLEFSQRWPLWKSSTVYLNLVCEQVPGVNEKKIGGRSSLRVAIQNWATSEASRRGRKRRIRKVNKEVISMPIVRQNRLAWDIAHSFFSLWNVLYVIVQPGNKATWFSLPRVAHKMVTNIFDYNKIFNRLTVLYFDSWYSLYHCKDFFFRFLRL